MSTITSTATDTWRVYGLDVSAPWPLSPERSPAPQPDLTILLGEERPAPADGLPGRLLGEARVDGHLREAAYACGGTVSLLFPGLLVATFHTERRECELFPDPGADPELVRRLVASAVLATWMILTDIPVLHASAVQVGDEALVFVGRSGSGKSTIAAALVGAGATAISDDVCRLSQHSGRWLCHPDAGQLRLRDGSHALAQMFDGDEVTATSDRLMLFLPTAEAPVPVAGIVIPRITPGAPGFAPLRLRGTRAVVSLMEHPRMASLMGDELSPSLFRFASSLVAAVPTWELVLPRTTVTPSLGADLLGEVAQMMAER